MNVCQSNEKRIRVTTEYSLDDLCNEGSGNSYIWLRDRLDQGPFKLPVIRNAPISESHCITQVIIGNSWQAILRRTLSIYSEVYVVCVYTLKA